MPTPAELLAGTIDAWGPEWVHDREVGGGDLVEWFFGTFLPDACKALGRSIPTEADYPDPDCDPCGKERGEKNCDCGWMKDHDEIQNPCRQERERDDPDPGDMDGDPETGLASVYGPEDER